MKIKMIINEHEQQKKRGQRVMAYWVWDYVIILARGVEGEVGG